VDGEAACCSAAETAAGVAPLSAAVFAIDETTPADTAAPPPPLLPESEDAEDEATAPAESVAVADAEDTPLASPVDEVEAAPDESVEVEDDPEFDESVEVVADVEVSEDPDELLPEPLLEPLLPPFALFIVRVQVLTSRTAALPLASVMGVSDMTQVCVISPAAVLVVDWVITVVACPSWRGSTGIAFARKRQLKRKRKARCCGRRFNMTVIWKWAI